MHIIFFEVSCQKLFRERCTFMFKLLYRLYFVYEKPF